MIYVITAYPGESIETLLITETPVQREWLLELLREHNIDHVYNGEMKKPHRERGIAEAARARYILHKLYHTEARHV